MENRLKSRMKAAVFSATNQPLSVEDLPIPKIGPNEVLVKIHSCGICRGDVQRLQGLIKLARTPIVLGHKPGGTIAEIGSEVDGDWKVGDPVALFAVGCGECYYCKIGKDNVCVSIAAGLGLEKDGAYAEYVKVSPKQLYKMPEGISIEAGSVVTASTGTAYQAISLSGVTAGDTAVVYGAGCLGTQALQLMKTLGAAVIMVDIDDQKPEWAKQMGADHAINSKENDPVQTIRELTEGKGADVSFEMIGLPQTMLQAIDSVRPGGKIMDVGSVMEPISLKMMPFIDGGLSLTKELTLQTVSHCTRKDMQKLLEILAGGKMDFETGSVKVPLDDVNEGFRIKEDGKALRVLVMP